METGRITLAFLYRKVVFPYCNLALSTRVKAHALLNPGDRICAFPVRSFLDIAFFRRRIATVAEVLEIKTANGLTEMTVKGITRARVKKLTGIYSAVVEPLPEEDLGSLERVREELRKKSQELIFLINVNESDKLIHLLNFLVNLHQLTDFVSNYFILKFPQRFQVYMETNVEARANMLLAMLDVLIDDLKNKRGQ